MERLSSPNYNWGYQQLDILYNLHTFVSMCSKVIPYQEGKDLFTEIFNKNSDSYVNNFLTFLKDMASDDTLDTQDDGILECDIHWLILLKHPTFLEHLKSKGIFSINFYDKLDEEQKKIWEFIKKCCSY